MDSVTPLQLAYAAAVLLGAYFVRGIAGFGSGLVAIPLLALVWPLHAVVPMVSSLDYMASLTHGTRGRKAVAWREIGPLLPFTLMGVGTALYLFKTLDAELMAKALGVFVIGYAVYALTAVRPPAGSRLWAAPAGSLGGLVGTLFGTGGPFYVIYLNLRQLDKSAFRATVATIFIIDGGLRLVGYFGSGFYTRELLMGIGAGIPLLAVGLYAGGHIHTTITQQGFVRLVSLLLLVSGGALLLK